MKTVRLFDVGHALFPNVRSERDIEARIKSEKHHTARNVYTCIRRLVEALDCTVDELFKHHGKTIAWIDGPEAPPSPASKLMYYNSLRHVCDPDRSIVCRAPARSVDAFRRKIKQYSREVRDIVSENRLDAREKVAILPWKKIVNAYNKNAGRLNDQQSVIAALYLSGWKSPAGAPRRLDYNALRIYSSFPKSPNPKENYIVVNSRDDIDIILQEFKTRKYYGPYNAKLPKRTCAILYDSIRSSPRKWLLVNSKGLPLTAKQLGERLRRVTRSLTGRPIGASNLRKSFITWLYEQPDVSEDRLKAYAKAMNHSPSEQKLYRRKGIDRTGGGHTPSHGTPNLLFNPLLEEREE